MEYAIWGQFVEFHFGGRRDGFHFAFDTEAIRKLAGLSNDALARVDAGELVGAARRSA